MAAVIEHKKGDSFEVSATYTDSTNAPIDISGYGISSEVRDSKGTLIDTLTSAIVSPVEGKYTLRAGNTSHWPVGLLLWDIKYTSNGTIVHTETLGITVTIVQTR